MAYSGVFVYSSRSQLISNSLQRGICICVFCAYALAGYYHIIEVDTLNISSMLLVWSSLLVPQQQAQLRTIDPLVSFWPRGWHYSVLADYPVPGEWWISFSHPQFGLLWILHYPDHSRIIYSD